METLKALVLTIILLNLVGKGLFFYFLHITDPIDIVQDSRIWQSVVPFIDSSSFPEVFFKTYQN